MAMIPFGEWRPDAVATNGGFAQEALNVIPRHDSYGPLKALSETGSALTARCQGAFSARSIAGVVTNFAGDATKLYRYASDTSTWTDISRTVGGAYATPSDGTWQFTQFGDVVIAVNGVDAAQSYTLASSTNFAALAGSPPIASHVATVGNFVMMGRVSGQENRVKWSGINNSADWTIAAATQCDQQDLPDGGRVMGIVGSESGAVLFQERAVRIMTYVGPPEVFRIDKVSLLDGALAAGSIAMFENVIYYLSQNGFMALRGQEFANIGDAKVDRFFTGDLDLTNRHRITSAIDYANNLYVIGYPSGSDGGTPGHLLMYHWISGRWSHAEVIHDMLCNTVTDTGLSLDSADLAGETIDEDSFLPLDSVVFQGAGTVVMGAFTTAYKRATFEGSNLAATIDTTEAEVIPGHKAKVTAVRPLVDGGSPTISVGVRDKIQDSVSYGTDVALNTYGTTRQRASGRYLRARVKVPSATWTHAIGVADIQAAAVGGG